MSKIDASKLELTEKVVFVNRVVKVVKGVMTDKKARKLGVGGEVICYVW
ncbi:30S ribosomal protein S8 [Peptococcaceae bacterium]|nr:30S ribosomal protein S8 [Peptococcaceae bacterium]